MTYHTTYKSYIFTEKSSSTESKYSFSSSSSWTLQYDTEYYSLYYDFLKSLPNSCDNQKGKNRHNKICNYICHSRCIHSVTHVHKLSLQTFKARAAKVLGSAIHNTCSLKGGPIYLCAYVKVQIIHVLLCICSEWAIFSVILWQVCMLTEMISHPKISSHEHFSIILHF